MSFAVSTEDLSKWVRECFENSLVGQVKEKVLPGLEKLGGQDGLISSLKTNTAQGIRDSEVETRRSVFGSNYVEPEPPTSIWELAWDALQDPCLIFLCFAALVSFFVGVIFNEGMEWLEGIAILSAVIVVVTVSAVNDYQKDQQFRELSSIKDDVHVFVIREGTKKKISTHDIVVGDVVMLSTGDMVVADGVVFEKNDLGISEAMLTGESVIKRKGAYNIAPTEPADKAVSIAPTVYAGTFVQEGEGRMVVLAVGRSTYQGLMEEKMKEDEESDSVLQTKLNAMTDLITKAGMAAGGVTVGILLFRFALGFLNQACCKEAWDHSIHHLEYLRMFVIGVTVFVVAVPEGLPLAVTIALAFSVKKMMRDQNLVRHLSACETMGSATTICSDKTGTLTTGRMTVVRVFVGGQELDTSTEVSASLDRDLKQTLAEGTVINSSFKSDVELDSFGKVVKYSGNDTECAMLVLASKLLGLSVGYKGLRTEYPANDPDRCGISFSSDRKRMSTFVRRRGGDGFRLHCKGAAEMVLKLCDKVMTADGPEPLSPAALNALNDRIGAFADQGLRTLAVAIRDWDVFNRPEAVDESLETGLTLVGLLGLEDPVRPEVPDAIRVCTAAGIVVRMVTGDNPRTAQAIARKCGILGDGDGPECVMTGDVFRERVTDGDEILQDEFDKIWPRLRVLARSSPLDKLTLVTGIQASKISTPQTVAVTGDGTNDAPALHRADVGFAMGIAGTQVAQNAADIIVMDDNFASIVNAVKWGRCVYDNICKFLQFQLTVNLTACFVAVIGASILAQSPLNVIQLLWVNMIMDSFASLALATEDPNADLLRRRPYPRDQPVLSPAMTRFLLCHAAWQMLILFVFIFLFGDICPDSDLTSLCSPGTVIVEGWGDIRSGRPPAFDSQFLPKTLEDCPPVFDPRNNRTYYSPGGNKSLKIPLRPADFCSEAHHSEEMPTQHYTMVFTIFVLLQLFNQINARKIHGEFKVWTGILDNKYFLWILGMEALLQVFMVQFPGLNTAMGCTGLTMTQWVFCFFVGATSLPLNLVVSQLPLSWFTYNLARAGGPAGGDAASDGDRGKKREGDGIKLLSMVDQ